MDILSYVATFFEYADTLVVIAFILWVNFRISELEEKVGSEMYSRMIANISLMSRYASIFHEISMLNKSILEQMSDGVPKEQAVPVKKLKALVSECGWVTHYPDGTIETRDNHERNMAAHLLRSTEYNQFISVTPDLFHEALIKPTMDLIDLVEGEGTEAAAVCSAHAMRKELDRFEPIYDRFLEIENAMSMRKELHLDERPSGPRMTFN